VYNTLYEAWKKEKEDAAIQKLAEDFYVKLADYLKKIKTESRMIDRKSVKGKLLETEFKNVQKLVKKFLQLRYEKTVRRIIDGHSVVDSSSLTSEEKKLYTNILALPGAYQDFLKALLKGLHVSSGKRGASKKIVVRFLKDTPPIAGVDLKTYGPFKIEDLAALPAENAKNFIEKKVAEKVEMK